MAANDAMLEHMTAAVHTAVNHTFSNQTLRLNNAC